MEIITIDSKSNKLYWFDSILTVLLYSKYSNIFLINKIIELKNQITEYNKIKPRKKSDSSSDFTDKEKEILTELKRLKKLDKLYSVLNVILNMQYSSYKTQLELKKYFHLELILVKIIKHFTNGKKILDDFKSSKSFKYVDYFIPLFYNLFTSKILNVSSFNNGQEDVFLSEKENLKESMKTHPDVIIIQMQYKENFAEDIEEQLANLKTFDSSTNIEKLQSNLIFNRKKYNLNSCTIINKNPELATDQEDNYLSLLKLQDKKVLYNKNLNFKNTSENCSNFIYMDWDLQNTMNIKLKSQEKQKEYRNNYITILTYILADHNKVIDLKETYEKSNTAINLDFIDNFNSISESPEFNLVSSSSKKSLAIHSLPSVSSRSSRSSYSSSSRLPSLSQNSDSFNLSSSSSRSSSRRLHSLSQNSDSFNLSSSKKINSDVSIDPSNFAESISERSSSKRKLKKLNKSVPSVSSVSSISSFPSISSLISSSSSVPSVSNQSHKDELCKKNISLYFDYSNSCYLDSILVALFHKYNKKIYEKILLSTIIIHAEFSRTKSYTLSNIALKIIEKLIKIYEIINDKLQFPRKIDGSFDFNNTTKELRQLMQDYEDLYYDDKPPTYRKNNFTSEELDIDDVIYFLSKIFNFEQDNMIINGRNIHHFSLLDIFKLSEYVKIGSDDKLNISNYYSIYGDKPMFRNAFFSTLLIKIDRLHTGNEKLNNIVIPSQELINGSEAENIVNLESIIIHTITKRYGSHYTCLFKCNDKWYEYNDIISDNDDKQSTVKLIGTYEDLIANETYMRNSACFVYY